jgi:hypothetical protein
MRRVDATRLARLLCAISAGLGAWVSASAATPVPLTPCHIGAVKLGHDMPLATVQAAVRRAFPAATMRERASSIAGPFRQVEVYDGADRIMTIVYLARSPRKIVNHVDLTSARFQLIPGVAPGTPLADVRALGPVTLENNPTTGVEDISALKVQPMLARWEQAGCPAQLRAAKGAKAGLYARGRSYTDRVRPGAKIGTIEIDL